MVRIYDHCTLLFTPVLVAGFTSALRSATIQAIMNSSNHATSAQSQRTQSERTFSAQACDRTSYSDTLNASADEKFELMSAYLDGEVSDQERRLVEHWLASDPQLPKDYQQQMKLRGAIQTLSSDLPLDWAFDESPMA